MNFNWSNNINYTTWNYKKTNRFRYSAGILPYTFDQTGKLLFLLGKDNDGDWSDFGGRCEFKDRSDEKNTATREFYEETLGAVMNIQECLEKINSPNQIKIISKTLNGSPYYMFLVYVDFLNYSDSFNKTLNYLKYTHSHEHRNIVEKVSIRWVTIDTLMNCIENKDSVTPISLRGVFFKTISSCKETLYYIQQK
jgi:hypothetical protein